MAKLAEAFVEVKVDTSKLKAGMDKVRRNLTGKLAAISKGIARRVSGIFTSLVRNLKRAAIAITAVIAAIGIASIKMASDVEESENLFEESMGKMAVSARAFSERVSKAFGLFAPDLRKMIGTFNIMFTSMGLNEKAAFGMAKSLSVLANDMASFFNLDPDVAFQKLQAGITGEVEPLKRLGILVNESTVKMAAFKNGIGDLTMENGKLTGSLSEQEKVFARFAVIMESTKTAQGDLFRTLPALANRFREFKNTVKDLGVSLGGLFLKDVADAFGKMTQSIRDNKDKIVSFVQEIKDKVVEWIKDQGGLTGIWDTLLSKLQEIKEFVMTELLPTFKSIFGFIKGTVDAISATVNAIKQVGEAIGITGGIGRAVGAAQGSSTNKQMARESFGKELAELSQKQLTVLESMMTQQTRTTAMILTGQ
jgi:hypothetical protein